MNREFWLITAIDALRPLFADHDYELPDVMVSCGFPSTGKRSRHIGQCWSRSASDRAVNQIFISPVLHEPVAVLDTLVHELVHAVDDCASSHGKNFKRIATSVGLTGPMRSTVAGDALKARLEGIALTLGPYPHSRLDVVTGSGTSRPARPRAICPECGFEVPMLKRFLRFGPPLCPQHLIVMDAAGEWPPDH
jgi:hypothetical protein